MKFIKFLFFLIILFGALAYGGYHFGTNYVSDKITDTVTSEINDENKRNKVRAVIEKHPEIKAYIEEGKHVDESELPFTNTEEAINTIVKNIGFDEIKKMYDIYQEGVSPEDIPVLIRDIESKLSEEEILALKAVAYKELYK